jgi:uncharacterized protein YbjT (DUF2867 family)
MAAGNGRTGYVKSELVTVFGGSGFIGRHVVRALARRGYRVRAAVRRPDLSNFLQPLGGVGQIHAVQANIRNRASIDRAVAGSDAVVNLVGILYESGRQRFDAVQSFGPGAIAASAKEAGVGTMVHVSAIGADPGSSSDYARSKAAGEAAVLQAFPDAVILRPSIVFGPEDDFFNRFGAMARLSPVLPLIGGGKTRFQPVFVGDVAEAVARGVDGNLKSGTVYELGGPEVRTFQQLMEYILEVTDRRRLLVPVPFEIARLKAWFLQLLPNPLLTVDQVRQLAHDNVVSEASVADGRTLEGIGIDPRAIESVVPTYLARFRKAGQFTEPDRAAPGL